MSNDALQFKIATEGWEFEAIHRLNYKTFVEEIPQHERNAAQRLVDKFHAENTYAICLHDRALVGMVAGRSARPFSLDQKLPDLERHLPPGRRVIEVRLLSVEKAYRNGFVFSRLTGLMAAHFRAQGYDLAVISGTVRQTRLYEHLGFVPFGPLVGSGEALFQPMYLTLEDFSRVEKSLSPSSPATERILASYLPGPVDVHVEVRKAFERGPVSHRSDAFMADFQATKRRLCALTGARRVEILVGSGSLANDAVCAQLRLLSQPGLILSNGEFGERLIDHATRQGLEFETHAVGWGEPFDYDAVRRGLASRPRLGWVWAVHCETSTGVLNDVAALQAVCAGRGIRLCLDCISAIGTVPVDLRGVYLASCVSGKALASFPGLSMVFYNHELAPAPAALPRYLDLGYYAAQAGVPFTHSSNLVYALQTALQRIDWPEKYRQIAEAAVWLRGRLRELGFRVVAPDAHASPAVVSIELPPEIRSKAVGWQLRKEGYLLSYNSEYLRKRNWIQVCLMGEWSRDHLESLPVVLAELCAQRRVRRGHAALQPA
ncbi:MAG: aminotransferase class V-fold PLP-dependent enzyme [Verrucomicrobia bacterium]|nr:aminotransferase class V-fold PLP-dependent enzyme [Verrucomicrobiota bacterium]